MWLGLEPMRRQNMKAIKAQVRQEAALSCGKPQLGGKLKGSQWFLTNSLISSAIIPVFGSLFLIY